MKVNLNQALKKARTLKASLIQKKYPIRKVFLFGSVARKENTDSSDIDIAIVTDPFLRSRIKENAAFLWEAKDIDLSIETVCLHPDNLKDKYSTLATEINKDGIEV